MIVTAIFSEGDSSFLSLRSDLNLSLPPLYSLSSLLSRAEETRLPGIRLFVSFSCRPFFFNRQSRLVLPWYDRIQQYSYISIEHSKSGKGSGVLGGGDVGVYVHLEQQ